MSIYTYVYNIETNYLLLYNTLARSIYIKIIRNFHARCIIIASDNLFYAIKENINFIIANPFLYHMRYIYILAARLFSGWNIISNFFKSLRRRLSR